MCSLQLFWVWLVQGLAPNLITQAREYAKQPDWTMKLLVWYSSVAWCQVCSRTACGLVSLAPNAITLAEMQRLGLKPNAVTFRTTISAGAKAR